MRCPNCHHEIRPRPDLVGKRVRCPSCNTPVLITAPPPEAPLPVDEALRPAAARERQPPVNDSPSPDLHDDFLGDPLAQSPLAGASSVSPAAPDEPDAFDIGPIEAPTPVLPSAYHRAVEHEEEKVAAVKASRPPDRPLLTGVFNYPWQSGETSLRWAALSVGWAGTGLVVWAALKFGSIADGLSGIVLVTFGTLFIMFFLWTFSYAAACGLVIVEETANGNNEVSAWPNLSLIERVMPILQVGFPVTLALTCGALVAWLATRIIWSGASGPITCAGAYIAFPIVMLSVLETASLMQPVSLPVLRGIKSHWRAWLTFYAMTGAMLFGWLLVTAAGMLFIPLITILVGSPLLGAFIFIYARLLGRLAWVTAR